MNACGCIEETFLCTWNENKFPSITSLQYFGLEKGLYTLKNYSHGFSFAKVTPEVDVSNGWHFHTSFGYLIIMNKCGKKIALSGHLSMQIWAINPNDRFNVVCVYLCVCLVKETIKKELVTNLIQIDSIAQWTHKLSSFLISHFFSIFHSLS